MRTNEENTVSSKLDQLDTLSGGIVFGKDEAWEKLQARMENKPARRIGLYYGLAAAIILLIACVFFLLRAPKQQQVVHVQRQNSAEKAVVAQREMTAVSTGVHIEPPGIGTHRRASHHTSVPIIEQPEIIKCPPAEPTLVSNEELLPPVVTNVAAPQPMRIVHINELDNDLPPVKTVAPVTVAFVPKKLKIVTLSEILSDGHPLYNEKIRRESMPLVKALFRQEQFTARSNTSTQNPFNIKINLQN